MQYLGLYSDGAVLTAALLKRSKRKIEIEWTRSLKSDVKPLYILAHEINLQRQFIVTGLHSNEILMRHLQLNLSSRSAIKSALPFQLEGLLPYPIEESILQSITTRLNKKETAVTVLSSPRKKITAHLNQWAQREIDPDFVSCVPTALYRFARHLFPQDDALIVFHLGHEQICAIIIAEGRLVEIVDTPSLLAEQQIDRLVAFCAQKAPEKTPVFFTGSRAESSSLRFQLEKRLASHFSLRLPPIERSSEIPHAISIGLALDSLCSDNHSIQFRITPSEKIKTSRRRGLRHALTAGVCSFLSILLVGNISIGKQDKKLLMQLEKSFPNGPTRLRVALQNAERSLLRGKPPPVPVMQSWTASELLAWLSHHPKLQDEQIALKRVHYGLEKYPRLASSKILPLVRVELELTTDSPRLARDFRQALLSDSKVIDQRRNIKWSNNESSYRAIFYLKNMGTR